MLTVTKDRKTIRPRTSVSVIYLCMFIYSDPLGFFSINSLEEEAEMKGYSTLGMRGGGPWLGGTVEGWVWPIGHFLHF